MSDSGSSSRHDLNGEPRRADENWMFLMRSFLPGLTRATAVPVPASDDEDGTEDESSDDDDDDESASDPSSVNESSALAPTARADNLPGNGHPHVVEKLDALTANDDSTQHDPTVSDAATSEDETSDESSEEDEDSEETDDDSDDDEDEEPALKYEKLGGAAQELFTKDSASALTVSLRLMVSELFLYPGFNCI